LENIAVISTNQPFSFSECYHFLACSPNEVLHIAENGCIRKLLKINNKLVLFELNEGGNEGIEVKILSQNADENIANEIQKYVKQWLDLDTDLSLFYALAENDVVLRLLVKKYAGLRLIGINDLFEAITWAIIGQQINLNFAYKLKKRWIEQFGESLEFEGKRYFLHPDFHIATENDYEDLLKMQFSKQKAEYVIRVAQCFQGGEISFEKLQKMSFEEAKNTLCKIKGIGNWTANYALMKSLRFPQAFPMEDVGLHNALKNQLNLSQKPTLSEIKRLAENWKNWESYATFYLWRSLI
jgi:DNA-3-methyladenine glycosylase II